MAGRRTYARRASLTYKQICLQYYNENDVFFSPEGILKMLSIVCCVALSVLSLRCRAECASAPSLAQGVAAVALAVAATLALLVAARALHLPRKAPYVCFITDIVVCSVCGVLGALTGVLRLALCRPGAGAGLATHYLQGGLALAIAGLLIASASLTYYAAMRLWDVAAGPAREPRTQPRSEHDV